MDTYSLIQLKDKQEQIFAELAKIMQSIASPVRMKLLHYLSQAPLTVEVLSQKIDQSIANTSMHLRKMLAAQIVQVTVKGQNRLYTLDSEIVHFWEQCQQLYEFMHPERTQLFSKQSALNWQLDLSETLKSILKKNVTLVDIRPNNEIPINHQLYENYVVHIAFEDLLKNTAKLKKSKPLLIICRGKYCALSIHAVEKLRQKNFNAYRFPYSWYALNKELQIQTINKKDQKCLKD
jgi:DNA-binding transcriptional ArsR family regulator